MVRRAVFIFLLVAAAAADVVFFRGAALVAAAKREISAEARIAILDKEQAVLPVNDELNRLLGQAHFEAGADEMGEAGPRDAHFQASLAALTRSLTLNPLSAAAHFDLAQGLEYFRLVGIPGVGRPFEEYLKAARLGLQDPEIVDGAGRLLLSQWDSLTGGEKRLTQGLLRTILSGRREDKLLDVLNTWALHVRDYEVIKAVLPEDAKVYRRFARFLAERSLDRSERIAALVRAETLEFGQARAAAADGQSEFKAFKLKNAEAHFRRGLDILRGIRFYQALAGKPAIDEAEFRTLRSTLALGIVHARLETARVLDEVLPDVLVYLEEEQNAAAVGELDRGLRSRGLIGDRIESGGKDLRRLAFEMNLSFKQNRYREITEAGQSLENGVLMVPDAAKKDYAAVLELVGDAYQKLDYLYESNAFYQKSRAADGGGIGLLFKLRRNYERLSDVEGLRAIDREIKSASAARTVDWSGIRVPKGTAFAQTLLLDGGEIRLDLRLAVDEAAPRTFVGFYFNHRVIWEDFLPDGGGLSFHLTPQVGENKLEILPWNGALGLAGLDIKPASEPSPAGNPDTARSAPASPSGRRS